MTAEFWTEITDELCADWNPYAKRIICEELADRSTERPPLDAAHPVAIWEWQPDDGTRYTIVQSWMPRGLDGVPKGEGCLISVLHPTQSAALFMGSQQGELMSSYVASNLHLSERDLQYTADALTVMLGAILQRPAFVRSEWWDVAKWSLWSAEKIKAELEARKVTS